MTDPTAQESQQPPHIRPDRRLQIYLSHDAWLALQQLMGADGKPSPTLNALILAEYQRRKRP